MMSSIFSQRKKQFEFFIRIVIGSNSLVPPESIEQNNCSPKRKQNSLKK